ncbi:MAG: thrombospondin type 3 repeat-containing protein [Gammaproteobacteria bacterium]
MKFMPAIGLLASRVAFADFEMARYFPLESGNRWAYTGDTVAIVQPDTVVINGNPTRNFLRVRGNEGTDTYFSNDAHGLRLHGAENDGLNGIELTFDPPLLLATARAELAQQRVTLGTAEIRIAGVRGRVDVSATATLEARERIHVPLGPYDTIRLSLIYEVRGTDPASGGIISLRVTEVFWFSEYIGPVKNVQGAGSESQTLELASTNVERPPDRDGDGTADTSDNCPDSANADQRDTDGDGRGDVCDTDDDNDGLSDEEERTRHGTDPLRADTDGDRIDDGDELAVGRNPRINEAAIMSILNAVLSD